MLSRTKGRLASLRHSLCTPRISTKITALYALLLSLILVITMISMGLGIYFSIYHQAEREIDLSVQQVLRKLENGAEFTQSFWADDPVLPGVVLRVTDITGRVVFENDSHFPPLEEVASHTRDWSPFLSDKNLRVADLGNWSIYHEEVDVMHNGSIYTLHFLRTITAERQFLKHVQQFLILAMVIGFLFALAMGYLASRRILKPIRDRKSVV